MNGDEAEGARIGAVADALDDARLGQTEAPRRQHLSKYDLAVLGIGRVDMGDAELGPQLAVGGLDAAAVAVASENAEDAIGRRADRANDVCLVGAVVGPHEARDGAFADAQGRGAAVGDDKEDRRVLRVARGDGLAVHLAIEVDIGDLDDADLRRAADRLEPPLAAALGRTGALDLADELLEGDAVGGRHAERAHDVALADRDRTRCNEFEELFAGRQSSRGTGPLVLRRRLALVVTRRLCASAVLASFCGRPPWHGSMFLSSRAWRSGPPRPWPWPSCRL